MKTITTTWWIIGSLIIAMIAAMLGFGGQISVFAASVISSIFLALFAIGLLFDGAMHLTQTPHGH